MKKLVTRHKWMVLDYIGCAVPPLTSLQKSMIRKQLEERYCPHCGEYIYNPYKKRKIKHYHHSLYKKVESWKHPFYQRIAIYPQCQFVEWQRRFPHVMRLMISDRDLFFYHAIKPQFIHRIPAVRMWSIDEWNLLYPHLPIKKDDGYKRLCSTSFPISLDFFYTPNLAV